MNGREYNSVINWTIKNERSKSDDTLKTIREIFRNLGVALPYGDCNRIYKVLDTNDYMGWRKCTLEEAKEAADNGMAAIGINEEKIVILSSEKSEIDKRWFTSNDLFDIIKVTNETPALTVSNLNFYIYNSVTTTTNNINMLIYRSRNRERWGFADASVVTDVTPIINEDLTYGQKSTYTICNNGTMISMSDLYSNGTIQYSVSERVNIIKKFFESQIDHDPSFTSILSEMVDHFVSGSGSDYSNTKLTRAVMNHPYTQEFVQEAIILIKECIEEHKGNIQALRYNENWWIYPEIREKHPVVRKMKDAKLYLPSYAFDNGVPGLSLAIDTWHGLKIELISFKPSNTSYSGQLRFNFYDHFGLDTGDLSDKKYGNMKAGYISAFRQWYILQHWKELNASVQPKPFVTQVAYNVSFNGYY